MSFGMGASFSRKTPDPPKEVDPANVQPSPVKKQKKIRDSSALERAIASAKFARQSARKNG